MATHETGELVDHVRDGAADTLDTKDEHGRDCSSESVTAADSPRDEEENVGFSREISNGKGELAQGAGTGTDGKRGNELQDQTNLLPIKQVIFVFLGLTCALLCSLLDQTMYVLSPSHPFLILTYAV